MTDVLTPADARVGARPAPRESRRRTMVLWVPDWPVVAAMAAPGSDDVLPRATAVAVLAGNVVLACSPAARAEGVRRGMRRRDAQSRCPGLVVLEHQPEQEARSFEVVLAEIEAMTPGVAPLRPGLCALPVPSRYYGGEAEAGAVLAERLVEVGVWDVRCGVADGLFAAEQAARQALPQDTVVVAPGGSGDFLAGLPVDVLGDTGPGGGAGSGGKGQGGKGQGGGAGAGGKGHGGDTIDLLRRLGLRTVGDVAHLSASDVHTRFGAHGVVLHRLARGEDAQPVSTRAVPPELTASLVLEPPLELAEQVAFSLRTTAERFVRRLADAGLVCTAVRVEVDTDGVLASSRTWLHPRWFSSHDLLDRVRWQLEAGRPGLRSGGSVQGAVDGVRLVPETVESLGDHAQSLFGGGPDEKVERGVARVQSMVGHEAVKAVGVQGGRSPASRQLVVPWGDRALGVRPATLPWPGSLPPPAPATVYAEPVPALVVSDEGQPVGVSGRGLVTSVPQRFCAREGDPLEPVASWAGPWPIEELWWDEAAARRVARFQVVGVDGSAWLMIVENGRWWTEARYD